MKTAHNHIYMKQTSKSTVEICSCGKWRHTDNNKNPIIEEVKIAHTATPWYQGINSHTGYQPIFGHDEHGNSSIPVFILDRQSENKDIEYMLKAVNNHDALVEALKKAIHSLNSLDKAYNTNNFFETIRVCQQALKNLESEA